MIEPGVTTAIYRGGPYVSQLRVLPILIGLLHRAMMPSAVHGEFQRIITIDEVNLLEKLDAAWTAFIRAAPGPAQGLDVDAHGAGPQLLSELVFIFMLRNPKIWEYTRDRVGALHGRRWTPCVPSFR